MKKLRGLSLAMSIGALLASTALAEPPAQRNELFLGIGDAGLIFMLDDVGTAVLTLGTVTYGDEVGGFQIVGGYQRWFSSWSSLGVTGSWAGARKTAYFRGEDVGKVDRRLITLMIDWRAHWLRRPAWDLYSGVAVGVGEMSTDLYSAPDEDGTYPTFHFIPIGVRGGRDWGIFAETGFGLNGFVKAGVSRRY